ncbi:hypothetical protein L6164_024776 [Bauhinia variegata]|uniref:Uncharacterized protein n=1 Tax=Bauhinia variegata TaxID=167791 RepID=A0ACB9LYJ8_BAUVA|nr:hypothetical protein L6164_024776 [Bauhinia variegata]
MIQMQNIKETVMFDSASTEVDEADIKVVLEKKQTKKIDEIKERERVRERAIRAGVGERAGLERSAPEACRKNMSDGRERLGKTTEARALTLEGALTEKAASEARYRSGNFVSEKSFLGSRDNATSRRDEVPKSADVYDGASGGSAQRFKGRHQRIGERVGVKPAFFFGMTPDSFPYTRAQCAKALADKNMRDRPLQKQQEERNRVAEVLDTYVKKVVKRKRRKFAGIAFNITMTIYIVTNAAEKKAHRKATLFVHHDKLQQRGVSIQQKYTSEKVFIF